MSSIFRSTIRNNRPDSFDLEGDKNLFDKITSDQEIHSGKLRPAINWDLAIGGKDGGQFFHSKISGESIKTGTYNDDLYNQNYSTLQKMMDPFVGITGLQNINKDVVQEYFFFLKGIDHLGILPEYFDEIGNMKDTANDLMITDLGSIIDINLISSFLDPETKKYNLLEVGGGYGRLAEVFFHIYGKEKIKYVLLDAVPASLMYSYFYLSKNIPDLKIGFYYNGDSFDMDLFDCYIMPSWHFDASKSAGTFDSCINIQSMQEMNQYHVDYYLSMFNEVLKEKSGIAYISNEKDYIFQGNWNYPKTWKRLVKTKTPRSWTRNSPTEVFIKSEGDFETENCIVDFIYSLQLNEYDRNLEQTRIITNISTNLQKSNQEISELRDELQKAKEVGDSALPLRYDMQDMERKLLKLNEYNKALEGNKKALEADKNALEEDKIILLQTIDTLEAGTKVLEAQIETIQSNLELVLNSSSWKITKPLRAFRKILTK